MGHIETTKLNSSEMISKFWSALSVLLSQNDFNAFKLKYESIVEKTQHLITDEDYLRDLEIIERLCKEHGIYRQVRSMINDKTK